VARPPIHPGEILADELEELGLSAAGLGRELRVPTNRVTQILQGKRAVTADTALRLGRWFGTGPELWLNLQTQYELRLAEQQLGQEIRETITPRARRRTMAGATPS
jgi:addiction module HigA family antidote